MILDSPIISGSSTVTGDLTVLGTLTANVSGSVTSASYATNAERLDGLDSTSFTTTSSFTAYTASTNASILSITQNIAILYVSSSVLDSRVTRTEATASSLTIASSSFSTRVSASEASISNLTTASSSFSTRTTNLETASGSFSTRTTNLETASGSFSTRVTNAESSITSLNSRSGSFATTGSNRFIGNQTVTGSLTITENLTVLGSSSISYVSQSTLNIGTNLITVNAQNPSIRFGGLAVIDSGSAPQVSGSWLFDSIQNRWIMIHQQTAGGALTSSIALMGPETYNNLGSETQITQNRLVKGVAGASGEHIGDSNISDTGTVVSINSATQVTGSLGVTGNVGIGTANTYYSNNLIVAAGSEGGITIANPGTTGAQYLMFADGTSGNDRFRGYMTYNHTDNSLSFATDANIRLTINSAGAATFSDEVRAGSWIATANNRGFTIRNAANTAYRTAVQMNSSNVLIFGQDTDITALTFGVGSEQMRITSGGNVGIGATSPAARLTVAGNATISSRVAIGVSDQSYASLFIGGDITSGTNQWAILTDPQLSGSGDNYAVFANARIKANTAVQNTFGIYIPSAEKLSGATITNNYALYIANQTSGAALNYSIYSSGGLNYFGGNVGIGVTNPQSQLHIYNSGGTATLRLHGTRTSDGSVGVLNFSNITDITGGYIIGSIGVDRSGFDNGGAMIFSTATAASTPTERMRITSGGTLLVNATNADIGGSVNGIALTSGNKILVSNNTTGIESYLYYGDRRGTNNEGIVYVLAMGGFLKASIGVLGQNDSLNNGGIAFSTITGNATVTERMRITSGGNVGIGITSPIGRQHNVITSSGTALYLNNTAGGGGVFVDLDFGTYTTNQAGYANAGATIRVIDDANFSGHITFRTKGGSIGASQTERVRIESGGNVGIGTTSPATRLDVDGNTTVRGSLAFKTTGTNNGNLIISDNGGGTATINNSANSFLNIASASSTSITAGNFIVNNSVGIGTTSPTAKLEVNGNIKAADNIGKFYTFTSNTNNSSGAENTVTIDGGCLYEYIIEVNPNPGGSSGYKDYYFGQVGVGIGWNGSALTQYIFLKEEQTAPRSLYPSGGGNITLSARLFWSGGVYTDLPAGTSCQIRFQGFNGGNYVTIFLRRLA